MYQAFENEQETVCIDSDITRWSMQDAAYATHFCHLTNGDFVIGYHDGLIKIKNATTEKILPSSRSKLCSLLTLKNGQILSNHLNGMTYLWNKKQSRALRKSNTGCATSLIELSNDIIAMGLNNSNILLFDLFIQQTVAPIGTPSLHISDILVLLPTGELLSCRRDTGTFYTWNIDTQRRTRCFRTHADLYSLSLLPDGKHLATSHRDGNIYIWNIEFEDCVAHFFNENVLIHSVAGLPNGYVAAGDSEGHIRIWNIRTNECSHIISVKKILGRLQLTTYVNHLLLLPDNQLAYMTNHEMGIIDLNGLFS